MGLGHNWSSLAWTGFGQADTLSMTTSIGCIPVLSLWVWSLTQKKVMRVLSFLPLKHEVHLFESILNSTLNSYFTCNSAVSTAPMSPLYWFELLTLYRGPLQAILMFHGFNFQLSQLIHFYFLWKAQHQLEWKLAHCQYNRGLIFSSWFSEKGPLMDL